MPRICFSRVDRAPEGTPQDAQTTKEHLVHRSRCGAGTHGWPWMAAREPAGIQQVAELLVDRFGSEAEMRAEMVTFALNEVGEIEQLQVWMRITWAVIQLQRHRARN